MAALSIDEAAGRLRRVLAVEWQGGCQDRAVMGGLDRLLSNLLAQQPEGETTVLAVIQTLGRHRYAELGAEERHAWIERALRLLAAPSAQVAHAATPAAAPRSTPQTARMTSASSRTASTADARRTQPDAARPSPRPPAAASPAATSTAPQPSASRASPGQPPATVSPVVAISSPATVGSAPRSNGRRTTVTGEQPAE